MTWRSMIFWYEPRQTVLSGHIRLAETEFPATAGARPVRLGERVKRKLSRGITPARLIIASGWPHRTQCGVPAPTGSELAIGSFIHYYRR